MTPILEQTRQLHAKLTQTTGPRIVFIGDRATLRAIPYRDVQGIVPGQPRLVFTDDTGAPRAIPYHAVVGIYDHTAPAEPFTLDVLDTHRLMTRA